MKKTAFYILTLTTLGIGQTIGLALQQGDSCSTPYSYTHSGLAGMESWFYSPFGQPDTGFGDGTPCGLAGLEQEYFLRLEASGPGSFVIETFDFPNTGQNLALAVYSGEGCNATCLEADRNSGAGNNGRVELPNVQTGDVFLIQSGSELPSSPNSIAWIDFYFTPADPCLSSPDDALEDNDNCGEAIQMVPGTHTNLFASQFDKDIYSVCIPPGTTTDFHVNFSHADGNINIFLHDPQSSMCGIGTGFSELAHSTSSTDNESITWQNTGAVSLEVMLEVSVSPASNSPCNSYDLSIVGTACGPVDPMMAFCDPMDANSTGLPTVLSGSMTGPATSSGLHLECTSGPAMEFGYVLVGTTPSEPGTPLGQGRLCLGSGSQGVIGRFNVNGSIQDSIGQFDSAGVLQNLVGTSTVGSGFDVPSVLPIPGSPAIQAGETWHFQVWHRDNAGDSQFSNGLSVTF